MIKLDRKLTAKVNIQMPSKTAHLNRSLKLNRIHEPGQCKLTEHAKLWQNESFIKICEYVLHNDNNMHLTINNLRHAL